MKVCLYKTFVLVSLLFVSLGMAGQVKVNGWVLDEKGDAVEAAAVMLLQEPGGQLLKYDVTDKEGRFALDSRQKGAGRLMVSHLSYRTAEVALPAGCDTTLQVVLSLAGHELKEVAVQGKRAPIEFKGGDWVVNAENFITEGTPRTIDVLGQIPGMMVNEDSKQITLNNKNVDLKFNGVDMPMSFEMLRALPSDLLDQIVLTPIKRAEHDGNANNAIIDIKTKKKYIDGFVGEVDGKYGIYRDAGFPAEKDATFFTMLMKKDFYLNLTLHGEDNKGHRYITDSTWYGETQSSIVSRSDFCSDWGQYEIGYNGNLNLSWNVKNGHRLNANFYFNRKHENTDFTTEKHGSRIYSSNHLREDKNKRFNPSLNVQYEASDSLPVELKLSYGYIGTENDSESDYRNDYEDGREDDYDYNYDLSGRQHVVKLDMGKMLARDKFHLLWGGKVNFAKLSNTIHYEPSSASRTNEDFDYKEQVASFYFSGSYDVARRLNVNGGVRVEYTNYDLELEAEKLASGNDYWNVLPYAGLTWNANENYMTSWGLSSGIRRPNYNALTPSVRYDGDYMRYTGNPWLKPSKSWSLEWTNNFLRDFSIYTSWDYTKDLYTEVLTDMGNGITESKYENCFDAWSIYVRVQASLSYLDGRFRIYTYAGWKWGKYRNFRKGFVVPYNRATNLSGYLESVYFPLSSYRLRIFALVDWSAYDKSFQRDTKGWAKVNAGVQYQCLKNRPLYFGVTGLDIFNTMGSRQTIRYDQNIRFREDKLIWQGIFFSISYSFQGGKDLKRQRVNDDVNMEEKRFDVN